MYRMIAFMLLCGVFALVPAMSLAQDEKKGDDPKAKQDEPKKGDEPKKADEPKPTAAEVKATTAEKKTEAEVPAGPTGPVTMFGKWPWLNDIAAVVAPLAGIFILAIIAIVLMGLRSDINKLMDQVLAEKKEG
jgi:biotin carboxyl carrier protein